jgi:hypothetical protein
MKLAEPSGLWLLALAVPIVVFYLLKAQRTRVEISSTWLWQSAAREILARHPFRRFRWVRSLILQLLALLGLAFAATRPFADGETRLTDRTAVIIDVSASMQAAAPNTPTRLAAAQGWARERFQTSGPSAEVMILTAGSKVSVASVFERDRQRLLRTVDQIQAEDAEGALAPAVELASARLAGASGKRKIIVLTDGALADRSSLFSPHVDLEIVRVGEPVENVGIVHVDTRPSTREGGEHTVQVFVRVKNYGAHPATRFVTLRQRNVEQPLASRKLQLAPDEDGAIVLAFDATPGDQGTGLIVELDPKDGLQVDDRAYTIVPEGRMMEVVMLEKRPAPWFTRALLADPELQVWTAKSEAEMNAAGSKGALLVYSGACPEKLPSSHFLILAPEAGPCLLSTVLPEVEAPTITSWRESDPRLRFLDLGDLHVQKAHPLTTSSDRDALVRTDQGVIVSHMDLQGRLGTAVGFDVSDSDWPLKASFVLFVRNVVEHAREQRLGIHAEVMRAGTAATLRVPLSVAEVELAFAEGDFSAKAPADTRRLEAEHGLLAIPPFSRAGFYQVTWGGPEAGTTLIATSLLSERESDLRDHSLPQVTSTGSNVTRATPELADWSWVLALLSLFAILADVTLATMNPRTQRVKS